MSNHLNLLVYGLPGAGKTWFAASFAKQPRFQPALYIDCFANVISLSSWGQDTFKPTYVRPNTYKDLVGIISLLKDPQRFMASDLGQQMGAYPKLVIVDTLSELQSIIADHVRGASQNPMGYKPLRIQDYGAVKELTLRFVKSLNRCPTHTIYTGWSSQVHASTETQPSPLTIQLLGSSRDLIMAFVNYAGYICNVEEMPYQIKKMYGISSAENDNRILISHSCSFNRGKNQLSTHKYLLNPTAETFMAQLAQLS